MGEAKVSVLAFHSKECLSGDERDRELVDLVHFE